MPEMRTSPLVRDVAVLEGDVGAGERGAHAATATRAVPAEAASARRSAIGQRRRVVVNGLGEDVGDALPIRASSAAQLLLDPAAAEGVDVDDAAGVGDEVRHVEDVRARRARRRSRGRPACRSRRRTTMRQRRRSSVSGETTRATAHGANTSHGVSSAASGSSTVAADLPREPDGAPGVDVGDENVGAVGGEQPRERGADVAGALDEHPDAVRSVPCRIDVRDRGADGRVDACGRGGRRVAARA